jgi:hypothetical protein
MSVLRCLLYGLIICTAAAAIVNNPHPSITVEQRSSSSVDTTVRTSGKMNIPMATQPSGRVLDPDEYLQSLQRPLRPRLHVTGPRQEQQPLKRLLFTAGHAKVPSHISSSRPTQRTIKISGIALPTTALACASNLDRS